MSKPKPRAKRRSPYRDYVFAACIAIALIATTQLAIPWLHFGTPAERTQQLDAKDIRGATIARQVGDKQCAVAEFDNATGHITDAAGCKGATVLDARGLPVPVGTVHRLESISKSFSGGRGD